jgi:hypothetical protein
MCYGTAVPSAMVRQESKRECGGSDDSWVDCSLVAVARILLRVERNPSGTAPEVNRVGVKWGSDRGRW